MKVFIRIAAYLVFAAALATTARPACAQSQPGEYEVKAAFLYNFLPFVEWPASPGRLVRSLRVCILGVSLEEGPFEELDGQEVMGRKLEIVQLASLADLGRCDVLFIGASEQNNLPRILKALQGTSILSIGDTAGLARQGVIINFYVEQKKIRFEINAAAARRAGLTISSKLLKLAGSVYGASGAGE